MLYYTQLIFVQEGREETFHRFEDHVLPLLKKYNGQLVCRVRLKESNIIDTSIGKPYEIHLVTFQTKDDFHAYAQDEERQKYLPLKNDSVVSAMLIEGIKI
jgi:antibiotic biosynthesis monooxygenase (ABM) superfamily enzyme